MIFASFLVTTNCNLNCSYCYEGHDKSSKFMNKDISLSAIDYTINHCNKYNEKECIIHFHGGEPLLAFDMMKFIISQLDKKNSGIKFKYSITTNAVLLSKDIIEFLVEKFDKITISIDGNKASHDKARVFYNGNGSFDNVFSNSLNLLKEKMPRVRMTITPHNVTNLKENIIFLINNGFKKIIPAVDYTDRRWKMEDIDLLKNQLKNTKHEMEKLGIRDVTVGMLNPKDIKLRGGCNGGIKSFNIDPDGYIYPCTYTVGKQEFIFGDIFSGINAEKLKLIEEINNKEIDDCKECNFYDYCITKRCKLINKCLENDYFKASAIVCNVENIRYEMFLNNT